MEKVKPLPIANLFLCCHDDVEFLAGVYSAPGEAVTNGPEIGDGIHDIERLRLWDDELHADADKCKELLRRLQIWDENIHASSGELDHLLRVNPELQTKIVKLLNQLIEAVETAANIDVSSSTDHANRPDGYVHVTEEDGSEASYQSTIAEHLVDVRNTINDLQKAMPSLEQSAWSAGDSKDEKKASWDLSHVDQKFPNVDRILAKTLGIAAWNRRQHLMGMPRAPTGPKSFKFAGAKSEVSYDEFSRPIVARSLNKQTPDLDTIDQGSTTSASKSKGPPKSSVQPKSSGETKDTSMVDARSEAGSARLGRLYLPCPPTTTGECNGTEFECPYCLKTLSNVYNSRIWRHHVMTDLEAYMCTSRNCHPETRSYRTKKEWFEHELSHHLLPRYWQCPLCPRVIDNRERFSEHLKLAHQDQYSESSIENVIDTCEKQPLKQLINLKCPLCQDICKNQDEWGNHVADELEQLALFALGTDSQVQTLEDDLGELSAADQENISRIFSPGIIKGLARDPNRLEILQNIIKQQEEEKQLVQSALGDHEPQDADRTTIVRELLLARQPRKRTPACTFPVSTINQPRDPDFFQRSVWNLKKIHETLQEGSNVCVIHGPGGVGKTLLALEYAHEFRDSYDACFWLHTETETGLLESMRHIAETLQLGLDGTEDDIEIVEISKEWMRDTDKRWLAIVDNLEELDVIRRSLPANRSGRNGTVIITTRDPNIAHYTSMSINLPLLDSEEGGEMLLHYFRDEPVDDTPEEGLAQELATLVGGLPVSIGLAAKYIASARRPIREAEEMAEIFEATLKEAQTTRSHDGDNSDDRGTAPRATLSYQETLKVVCDFFQRELPRHSRDLVNILAYFNSEAIPQKMLWAIHDDPALKFLNPLIPHKQKRTTKALLTSRFVTEKEVDGEICLSIHRELQRSLRQNLRDDGRQDTVFNQAVNIMRREFPEPSPIQAPEEDKWPEYKRLLPHVSTLRELYMNENAIMPGTFRGSEAFVTILSEAGINQWDQGVNKEGLEMVTAAEHILQHDLKDNSSPLKADLDVLIALMMERGISERRDALERRMNVLKLRKRFAIEATQLSREEQIKLYNAHSDLAFSLLEYNDYSQAEKLFKICSKKYRQWESEGYQNVSYEWVKYHNAMASIRLLQGRYNEAERAAEEAMYISGQLGNKSGVLKWKFLLASIFLQKGDFDRALKTHIEVRDERREKAGLFNELTLESCYAVGAIQELLGRYEDAERNFRESLAHHQTAGWCEEGVARAKYHLARVVRQRGKSEQEASKLEQEARAVLHRLLPMDKPAWLYGEEDEVIFFDHLRSYLPRFTGIKLLKRFQAFYNPKTDVLSPIKVDELVS